MTAAQTPAIQVQGVEKSYKDLHVLRGVDFDVARGSIFALLGSNGAGKTTVARILSTLLKADAGTASVNGFDVATQAADVRESISLTGQFAAVDEILSGRENLMLIAHLRHLKDPGTVARSTAAPMSAADPSDQSFAARTNRSVSVTGDRVPPRWVGQLGGVRSVSIVPSTTSTSSTHFIPPLAKVRETMLGRAYPRTWRR